MALRGSTRNRMGQDHLSKSLGREPRDHAESRHSEVPGRGIAWKAHGRLAAVDWQRTGQDLAEIFVWSSEEPLALQNASACKQSSVLATSWGTLGPRSESIYCRDWLESTDWTEFKTQA